MIKHLDQQYISTHPVFVSPGLVIEAAVYILMLTDYLGILNLLSMSERQETIWPLKIVCVNIQRKKGRKKSSEPKWENGWKN